MSRFLVHIAIACLLVAGLAGPAAAASPHQLDPAQMVPPLNPGFGPWTCTATGQGSVCRGETHDAWQAADTGLTCDGASIYTTGRYDAQAARWHLPDGRAVHTFFQNADRETWSLAPDGTGPSVEVKGTWNLHYVYPIPGDIDTRVETLTGADWQVTAQGVGVVFHDIGLVLFNPGLDNGIELTHGPTDSDHGDLDLVLPAVCAALAG